MIATTNKLHAPQLRLFMLLGALLATNALAISKAPTKRLPRIDQLVISDSLFNRHDGKTFLLDVMHSFRELGQPHMIADNAALPENVLILPTATIRKIRASGHAHSLLKEMETRALNSIVLVDCETAVGSAAFKSCGLYHYGRDGKGPLSRNQRIFRTPIDDIGHWGQRLGEHFVANLQAYDRLQNEQAMKAMTAHAQKATTTKPLRWAALATAGNTAGVPQLGLGLAWQQEVHRFEVAFATAQKTVSLAANANSVEQAEYQMSWQQVSIAANMRFLAVHQLVWQLAPSIGYDQFAYRHVDAARAATRSGQWFIALRPGVGRDFGEQLTISYNLEVSYSPRSNRRASHYFDTWRTSNQLQLAWLF